MSRDDGSSAAPPARPDRTARAGALVTAGILASRLAGFVRQRALAHYLGTSEAADAVTAAFRIGNVTQNLLGEGTLGAAFVPAYVRLRLDGQRKATRFARAALGVLLPAVLVLSVAGVLFAPALAALVAPGFEGERLALTTSLVRILFPMTGLLVIAAWALGLLTAHRRFLLPYAAPVLWSVCQIGAVVVAGSALALGPAEIATAVAYGALGGALLQLVVMLAPLRRLIGSVAPTLDPSAEGVGEALAKLPAAVLGRGAIQLSGLIDTYLVSFLGAGAVAALGYAQTIYLLPMAVLGTGEAAAALPDLAQRGAGPDQSAAKAAVRTAVTRSATRVLTLAVAAAAVLGAMAAEVTTLLFRGGSFGASSVEQVAGVLAVYAAALPANALSRVLGVACFALGDTRRPATFAAVRVAVSTAVGVVAMREMGVAGVVLGAAVGAWVELALLGRHLHHELDSLVFAEVPSLRIVAVAALSAAAGLCVRYGASGLLGPVAGSAAALLASAAAFALGVEALGLMKLKDLLGR